MRGKARRCGTLGGAAILALICSGAGLPPPLAAPGPSPQPWGPSSTVDANPPRAGASAALLGVSQQTQARTVAKALEAYATSLKRAEARRLAAVKTWKLRRAPLRAPAPPADKPEVTSERGHLSGAGLPPVLVRVPTDEKVVFLTIDDGAEKDPDLLRMLNDLRIPWSGFLSDHVARDDYGYFREAHRQGAGVHNHSISHPELPALSYREQREEICEQQDILEEEIGERPTLFRPPYGAYDRDTLRAAASCGVRAVPLWAEEAFPDRIEWGREDRKFHPGDIILTHFRGEAEWDGSMTDMVRRVLDTATRQGFAVARLEDYL
ncbi:polysaccharide deacetylase family protein [Streptomyces sp. DSM 44917]|uniref:Polysaccharide deacetylase family protein n=1 Tax=Streptomyces boetiae TaxID=3075541 RepID=A0ABU2LAE5_9ACTN|nr:polysaccharide deacetylase family protein [Streptomyces sp. DSM 44917]MDT0308538.1 polysaccharide deacetylase family protein [Streptomyces sp. DSM 44917]